MAGLVPAIHDSFAVNDFHECTMSANGSAQPVGDDIDDALLEGSAEVVGSHAIKLDDGMPDSSTSTQAPPICFVPRWKQTRMLFRHRPMRKNTQAIDLVYNIDFPPFSIAKCRVFAYIDCRVFARRCTHAPTEDIA